MTIQEKYIKRCITLAKNGFGTTYPNPMVGSVVVHNDKIIGEGWHYKAGQPHAEVNAIASVRDTSLLEESTIYVSLEPCNHFGKTPPCSDLIIQKGIKKVVIGTVDTFAKVSGAGIQKLMQAGCDVTVGILEKECLELNKRFFTFHNKKRPYIILKWAETKNKYIAPKHTDKRAPVWITNARSRQLVHKWRTEENAILVGGRTVVQDNPKLTSRDWSGQNPVRIIIDKTGKIPDNSYILDRNTKTIILTSKEHTRASDDMLIYETLHSKNDIEEQICTILHKHDIQSVIIEGGAFTLQSFIDKNLWDEARVFTGDSTFINGIEAPSLTGNIVNTQKIVNDVLTVYQND
ncbi:bifunctional diaminohydroxyphosphoribosylaminopyrimidine deaminase/5-amino-6-(5-phosphoribosylamino)uracil reductase RibD [Aquimarina algicola]|uniref:Riboflavin biosynthesis protein RibD n=1 Tax=Aquimarina algicola TaxID=2589995 RepID=A0A504IUU1_9FLAO|nr:bifunctional diaminohydroxyphosphoribosylaminopyrimidine deaminase/5-amino-6-(5-phosphoribosylamino)uracil reductase RibD [Aquimarina algicola]TPN82096.1 bifunctional diaminohydroxyphosphoribosylaminopyrimidine deaminase/5-amino-6-(5-phosphoribosylamino)uracil reductase RibD [Aquimarina algicola]